jgi:hypothetical protein
VNKIGENSPLSNWHFLPLKQFLYVERGQRLRPNKHTSWRRVFVRSPATAPIVCITQHTNEFPGEANGRQAG